MSGEDQKRDEGQMVEIPDLQLLEEGATVFQDGYSRYGLISDGVDALTRWAYWAGRQDAAQDILAADMCGWPGGRQSEVDGCQELAAKIARGVSGDAQDRQR